MNGQAVMPTVYGKEHLSGLLFRQPAVNSDEPVWKRVVFLLSFLFDIAVYVFFHKLGSPIVFIRLGTPTWV